MSERIHALAQQLLGKSSVEECNLQEVEELAKTYPYFAPAQFLFLQKLKQEGSTGYNAQLQKAVLFYHNPLEFEYFINSEKFYTELSPGAEEKISEIADEQPELKTSDYQPTVLDGETEILNETPTETTQEEIPAVLPSEKSISEVFPEHTEVAITEFETPNTEEPIEIKPEEIQAIHPSQEIEEPEEQQTDFEEGQTEEFDAPDLPKINLGNILSQSEPRNQKSDTVFEPYHTVDYFASQGIKSLQEEAPQDKFGKQLKSFTQWLKAMKRLPSVEIQKNIDPATEVKLVNMANDSVHEANVVTEAMAEVWLKQGNTAKAIEIYNNLCLLDPSKKAFFAAKIEHLKNS